MSGVARVVRPPPPSSLSAVDHVVDDRHHEQRERGRDQQAEDERPGEAGEDRIERDRHRGEHGRARRQEDRPEAHRAALQQRVLHGQALGLAMRTNSISRIALRTTMPASAIMPIMAVAVKKIGLPTPADRLVQEAVQQPEARHDADHRQRDRDHEDQRHQVALGLATSST